MVTVYKGKILDAHKLIYNVVDCYKKGCFCHGKDYEHVPLSLNEPIYVEHDLGSILVVWNFFKLGNELEHGEWHIPRNHVAKHPKDKERRKLNFE